MQLIKSLLLIVLIVCLAEKAPLSGQDITITEQIEWKSNLRTFDPHSGKSISLLYFENAVYNTSSSLLPLFQGRFKLNNFTETIQIELLQCVFEEIPENNISVITSSEIADSIIINKSVAVEQKAPYLIYSFVPLRKNLHSGKIERLKLFTLKIKSNTSVEHLKSGSVLSQYVTQSVLQSGDWYKFFVDKSGVYQITYSDLKNLGLKNPEHARIYGNGGRKLPEIFSRIVQDDIKEIPLMMIKGTDNIFNEGDYILFYAEGPVTHTYDKNKKSFIQQQHPFNSKVSYFITSNPGGAIVSVKNSPDEAATIQVNSFDGLRYHEKDLTNVLKSGQDWYGEEFKLQNLYTLTFSFPSLIDSEPINIKSEVIGKSGYQNSFSFYNGNQLIGVASIPSVSLDYLAEYAKLQIFERSFTTASDNLSLQISYEKNGDPSGVGWLNYISLWARQSLNYIPSAQLDFRDSRSVANGAVTLFQINNASTDMRVWDITDINDVKQINGSLQDKFYTFKAKADELREYIAFDIKTGLLKPEIPAATAAKVENQNLHGLKQYDFIIITHPLFIEQANELANIHTQRDGISTVVVTPDQIYNEFSSGMQDPAAIRNFVKMFYDRGNSRANRPKYLLLFGDGSYDNRTPYNKDSKNTNLIITFESKNSLYPTSTFVSDDYFGLLDDNEAIVENTLSNNTQTFGLLDIGIGRLPVQTVADAKAVLNKIKQYQQSSMGDWRNRVCFIGDDEDENIHMQQADELATYTAQNYPNLNIEKVYLDSYQQTSSSTGQRYPEVNSTIQNHLNRGLLVLNYTGHGGERGLAHEQIMRQNEDINQWRNKIYPLFITATCEFSRFDNYEESTAGEDVLLNPDGGGIALLTTNRLVYSAPNFVLNQQFYRTAFEKSDDNPSFRLGDIIRRTKNSSGTDLNKLNFVLLGDPALSLAIPAYSIKIDSINQKSATSFTDTLSAFSLVKLKGHIENTNGSVISNYNGTIIPTVYDKAKIINTLANDGGTPFRYDLQNNLLFKGKASVKNGEFTVQFILPRDIDYSFGSGKRYGKISLYAWDSISDATGNLSKVIIGGLSTNIQKDENGPEIRLFMNDTSFLTGGITNEYPTLLAKVKDESGINPGGNSLGHDIVAVLDNDPKQNYILNSFFESDLDNYKQGSVVFKLPKVSPGEHVLRFKIWDIFNNSSDAELKFNVLGSNKLSIQNVYNYPNPCSNYTNFFFEHNQASEDLEATIELYNLSGNKITEIKTAVPSTGFTSGPVFWDVKDKNNNKISGGIYFYRIILRSSIGTIYSNTKKIIIIKQ